MRHTRRYRVVINDIRGHTQWTHKFRQMDRSSQLGWTWGNAEGGVWGFSKK